MVSKRRLFIVLVMIIGIISFVSIITLLPLDILPIQHKPEQAPQPIYDYYLIIDEKTNESLMYVPLVVSIGDEVITEKNQRYKVIRIEENRAYARFVENISLDKYNPKK